MPPLDRFKALYWPHYAEAMAACEKRLARESGIPGDTLGDACGLTLSAGGKRLRPLLVHLAAGRSIQEDSASGKTPGESNALRKALEAAAVAVELIHMATLVHDDVLDEAELRRGQPTLAAKYGRRVSTAAGDYLFSSAFEILTETRSGSAVSLLARASLGLSLGELMQMEQAGDLGLSVQAYSERCRLKTSGLFSAACMLGALLSSCSQETVDAMDIYGRHLGLAFQIADDILDFSADSGETGKAAGTDLRDGTVTLPLLLALERDTGIAEMFSGGMDSERVGEICGRVEAAGALDAARQSAQKHVGLAVKALESVADEIDVEPLGLIAESAADRTT